MGDPVFAERLRKLESEQVRCAAVALNNSASDAIATMHALLDDSTPPSVRLGAARALLEFGRLYREAEALELRLLAVEDRLRGLAQP
jgi:HEAT repeat protein